MGRKHRATALLVAAVIVLTHPAAATAQVDDCVEEKIRDGMRQTQAIAECAREQRGEETPATTTAEVDTDDSGTSTTSLVIAGAVGAAAGLALGWLLARRKSSAPVTPARTAPTADSGTDADHRRLLVAGLVDLRDRVSSDALRAEIGERLEQVGVREVLVEAGTVFDPAIHRGVDTRAVDDPSWDGRVAETERPGYTDGGAPVRPPEVVVYRHESRPAT